MSSLAHSGLQSSGIGVSFPIATLLTSYFIKTTKLDASLYGIVYPIIGNSVEKIFSHEAMSFDYDIFYVLISIAAALIVFCIYNYKYILQLLKKNRIEDKKYIILNIYNDTQIDVFMRYTEKNPTFYSKTGSYDFGNPNLLAVEETVTGDTLSTDLIRRSKYKKAINDCKIMFDDTNFKVSGYYTWLSKEITIYSTTKDKESQKIDLPYIQLNVDKTLCNDILQYYENITKYMTEIDSGEKTISHIKIFKNSKNKLENRYEQIYKGQKKSIEELENIYMTSFFHPEKTKLWNILKTIDVDPLKFISLGQSPRCNLLLHGPPGTGKSTFAYRVAMCLNRHVISLDLRLIKSRSEIYQIMKSPSNGYIPLQPKDVVFILDEFDLTVRELYYKEKFNERALFQWVQSMNTLDTYGPQNDPRRKLSNPKKSSVSDDKMELTPEDILHNIINGHNSDSDSDSEYIVESTKKDTGLNSAANKKCYSLFDQGYNDDDGICLQDLLELFQGPVPSPGSIIIATSNKFEEMSKMCPALFRSGRLTPVYFGHADANLINQMCKHYFNKEIELPENYISTIPTSQIIDCVVDTSINHDNDFEYFNKEMKKMLKLDF